MLGLVLAAALGVSSGIADQTAGVTDSSNEGRTGIASHGAGISTGEAPPVFHVKFTASRGGMDQLSTSVPGCTLQFSYTGDGLDAAGDDWVPAGGANAENLDILGADSMPEHEVPTHGASDIAVDFAQAAVFDAPTTTTGDYGASDFLMEIFLKTSSSSTDDYAGTSNGNSNGWAWRHTVGSNIGLRLDDGTTTLTVNGSTNFGGGEWVFAHGFGEQGGNLNVYTNGATNGPSSMATIGDLGQVATFNIGSNGANGLQTNGAVAIVRMWTCDDVTSLIYADFHKERLAKLTGFYTETDDVPSTATRASPRPCFKEVSPGERMAFKVGSGWLCNEDSPLTGRSGYTPYASATNVFAESRDISTTWTLSNGTATTDDDVAPDGSTTADRFNANGTDTNHGIQYSVSLTSGVFYTMSAFVKAGSRDWMRWVMFNGGSIAGDAYINIATGEAGTVSSGSLFISEEPVFNDYYYVALTTNIGSATGPIIYYRAAEANGDQTFAGTGSEFWIWEMNLTQTIIPHPYITTDGGTAASQPDVLSYTRSDDFTDTRTGTMITTATWPDFISNAFWLFGGNLYQSSGERVNWEVTSGDSPRGRVSDGDSGTNINQLVVGDLTDGETHTVKIAYLPDEADQTFVIDASVSTASGGAPDNLDLVNMGHNGGTVGSGQTVEEFCLYKESNPGLECQQ